jgi:hypothetical protein
VMGLLGVGLLLMDVECVGEGIDLVLGAMGLFGVGRLSTTAACAEAQAAATVVFFVCP